MLREIVTAVRIFEYLPTCIILHICIYANLHICIFAHLPIYIVAYLHIFVGYGFISKRDVEREMVQRCAANLAAQ